MIKTRTVLVLACAAALSIGLAAQTSGLDPATTLKPLGPACCQPSIVAPSKSSVKPGSTVVDFDASDEEDDLETEEDS